MRAAVERKKGWRLNSNSIRTADEYGYVKLANIAEVEFVDVTTCCEIKEGKLRPYIVDEIFLDMWFPRQLKGKYYAYEMNDST